MAGVEALVRLAPQRPGPLSTVTAPLWRDERYDDCSHLDLLPLDPWGWRACGTCAASVPPEWQEYELRWEDPALVEQVLADIRAGVPRATAFERVGVPPAVHKHWLAALDATSLHLQARVRRAQAEARADVARRTFLTDPKWWATHGPEARGRAGAHEDAFGEAPRDLKVTQEHGGTVKIDMSKISDADLDQIIGVLDAAIDVTPTGELPAPGET